MITSTTHWVYFGAMLAGLSGLTEPGLVAAGSSPGGKPVLLYTRYYNAAGETRYLPDGTYQDVLGRLRQDFDVRVNSQPMTDAALRDVKLLLIANPSDKAVRTNPTPHHVSEADVAVLTRFIQNGGGLIIMGNQENHNLEVNDVNRLMAKFGLQFTNLYTDAKKLVLPQSTPIIGGLRWAYYTGNLLLLEAGHPARPQPLVVNDLAQKPATGTRDQPGVLLAIAEPGKGRVVAVTDAGWLTNDVFSDKGIGINVIKGEDNWEICRRLARWAAGLNPSQK